MEELSDPATTVIVDATVQLVFSVLVELLHHDQIRYCEKEEKKQNKTKRLKELKIHTHL